MSDVQAAIRELGGFATTRELTSSGVTDRALTRAVRDGLIKRVRRGIYSTHSTQEPEFRAVRLGGRLTGLSALAPLGCWIWKKPIRLQVAVDAHATRLRHPTPGTVDIHWEQPPAQAGGTRSRVSVKQALIRAVLDELLESAVAALDWALHTGHLSDFDFEELILELPLPTRSIRHFVDSKSQSVLESVARVRLLLRGWSVRPQARLRDLEAIDLVVEEFVALELDGREFHADSFDDDRLRDLWITVEGRHSIRISRSLLISHWNLVERAIAAALAARRNGDAGHSGVLRSVPRGGHRHHAPHR